MKIRTFLPRTLILWFWLGVAALAIGGFLEITYEIYRKDSKVAYVDQVIINLAFQVRTGWLNSVAVDITALGSTTVVSLLSFIFLVVFYLLKDRISILHLLAASAGAALLSQLLKHSVGRARPEIIPPLVEVSGFSYPSGHALVSASLYFTFAILGFRYFKTFSERVLLFLLSALVVLLVGLSRIYLGVHYPSDVAGGTCIGAAWAFLLAAGVSWVTKESESTAPE